VSFKKLSTPIGSPKECAQHVKAYPLYYLYMMIPVRTDLKNIIVLRLKSMNEVEQEILSKKVGIIDL